MAHELCHLLHGPHTETLPASSVYDQTDYVVYGDQDKHTHEADLTCALCTLSVTGVHTLDNLIVNSAPSVVSFDGSALHVELYYSHFSIRGPPVHMTIS